MFWKKVALCVLGLALLVAMGSLNIAQAQPDPIDESEIGVVEETAVRYTHPSEYETVAKWDAAKGYLEATPMELPTLTEAEFEQLLKETGVLTSGAEWMSEGALPDPASEQWARELYPDAWEETDSAVEDSPLGSGLDILGPQSVNTFTQYYVNVNTGLQKMYPHTAMGKLFFTVPGQTGRPWCSAAVVGNRTVLTAGHCVYTHGAGWHHSYAFYPAFRNGVVPAYGVFTSYNQGVAPRWYSHKDYSNDVAVLRMNDKNGRTIQQWVGKLAVGRNLGVNRHFHAFGYPGNISSGNYLIASADQAMNPASHILSIGTTMQGGASGGPWLTFYQPGQTWVGRNVVESVNSFRYIGQNGLYGPYFDDANIKVLCNWAGC